MSTVELAVNPFSFVKTAVTGKFADVTPESAAKEVESYVALTLLGFMFDDSRNGSYHKRCAYFAMLTGEDKFDRALKEIQKGDYSLFHTTMCQKNPYLGRATSQAERSYGRVAKWLETDDSESFFSWMSDNIPLLTPAMGEIGRDLNIMIVKTSLHTSVMEDYCLNYF